VFPTPDYFDQLSISNLWKHAIPTANEYSQLVTAQMFFLNAALFRKDVSTDLNRFDPWISSAANFETMSKTLQALGVRYIVSRSGYPEADFPADDAPSGATDIFARLAAQKLSEHLGKQFYVSIAPGIGAVPARMRGRTSKVRSGRPTAAAIMEPAPCLVPKKRRSCRPAASPW
jgi:hypothetical protein